MTAGGGGGQLRPRAMNRTGCKESMLNNTEFYKLNKYNKYIYTITFKFSNGTRFHYKLRN